MNIDRVSARKIILGRKNKESKNNVVITVTFTQVLSRSERERERARASCNYRTRMLRVRYKGLYYGTSGAAG